MKLCVVLVRTEYSANVGAAARACANMGVDDLILIDPRCEINSKSKQMAAGAQEHLQAVRTHDSWTSFYDSEPEGIRIALSRRGGKKRKVTALKEKVAELAELPEKSPFLYLIFGPEADGLDSSDLDFVNFVCDLPTFGEFGSLNLAQAVLLGAYLAREKFPPDLMTDPKAHHGFEPVQPFYFPDVLIREWLESMGFDIQARRSSAYLTLRRLFMQNLPTRHELQVLESILQQNIRKLKGRD